MKLLLRKRRRSRGGSSGKGFRINYAKIEKYTFLHFYFVGRCIYYCIFKIKEYRHIAIKLRVQNIPQMQILSLHKKVKLSVARIKLDP